MSNIILQHYDVISCKQLHLIVKHHWCKEISPCYSHRKFGKDSSIKEGVIAFSKKVHVFLRHPVLNITVMLYENRLINGVAIAIIKSEYVCHLRVHNSAVMTLIKFHFLYAHAQCMSELCSKF